MGRHFGAVLGFSLIFFRIFPRTPIMIVFYFFSLPNMGFCSLMTMFSSAALAKAPHMNCFSEEVVIVLIFLFGLFAVYSGKSFIGSLADRVEKRFHFCWLVLVDNYQFTLFVKHLLR